ncbi:MAG: cytochrome o ubiquinol oxidase [Phycisphaerae bacterium]|nr:MAG: cytochrome o ubiquinol oxidase [Phycisphaerae bacterium]
MQQLLDIFRDLPGFLDQFIQNHGLWVYALLFAIIFAETGLVIAPFLPGDSLLFTVGALSARGSMNVWAISALLIVAGILGDAVNYHIGKWIGPRVFTKQPGEHATRLERALNRKHLARAHAFYEKYGGKAVVLGRFVPIARTFVPFVAGAGAMSYSKFVFFNILGAVLWVGVCVGAGYLFGNIEWVKRRFEAVIVGIIVVSLIPLAVEFVLERRRMKRAAGSAGDALKSTLS